jgi:TonB family protein
MPPTAKDLDAATSNAQSPAGTSTGKAQPVALEVPVTINGARTVEGSDKREPFSETTQTVLVFGNGAVIRLASAVTPGQLLFLTNEKTKKEVVCQVLKSKNYSNVSGYVELEFTEAVFGFWGVRFPESAPKQASAPAPVAKAPAPPVVAPTVPKAPAPAASSLPKPPVAAPPIASSVPHAEVKAPISLPRTSAGDPSSTAMFPKPPALPVSIGGNINASSNVPEIKPSAPVAPKAPVAPLAPANVSGQSSDALKRESARLQEQLSSMLFQAQGTIGAPPTTNKQSSESSAKVIDITRSQAPAKVTTSSAGLEADEVKIPSWLEPLARNAATPAHTEIAAREEAEPDIEFEVQDVSAPATSHEIAANVAPEPALEAPSNEFVLREPPSAKGGNKMILIGTIAAGLLVVVAGGTWFARQPSSKMPENAIASTAPVAAPTSTGAQPAAKTTAEASSASAGNSKPAPESASPVASAPVNSQPSTPTAQPLKGASDRTTTAELSAYKRLAEPQPQPVQPATKKPSIGSVKLNAPAAARRTASAAPGEADLAPSFGGGQVAPTGDAMGGGLAGGGMKQPVAPAAPLPVGGDVKQAKLISSTPPLYPTLAKTQHIEGAVRVDALVDESGRVSLVKIVSGPTLLQQAALDAIRQWKYQPATLDGKAVPMHLTVTLQFKLQ